MGIRRFGPLHGLALAASLLCAAPAAAQDWRELTRTDLAAAAAVIRDNHPGMVPEVGDTAFVARFNASLAKAEGRVGSVTDAAGMDAVLRGFAAGLGDDHIAWAPNDAGPPVKSWAGIMVGQRGRDLVVSVTEPGGPPLDARLVECDGEPVQALLLRRLADHAPNPDIQAQLTINSIWTLLDDDNPFIARPRACTFEKDGATTRTQLTYRPVTTEDFQRLKAGRKVMGLAGFGVRQVGDAWWIGLQSLNQRAPAVIEAAKARQAELRAAPLVVIDMRGNGGGSSPYGDQLAAVLLGDAPIVAVRNRASAGFCLPVWRASKDNRKTLDAYAERFPEQADAWKAEGRKMDEALAAGHALAGKVEGCRVVGYDGPPPPHPLFKGRLVVITDAACFSSCPLVVQRLRDLGAVQVGQPTNAPTRYMEVRAVDLPSGRGAFTTLQKAAISSPPMIGPYAPHIAYPGDITDTAALEAWVPGAVKPSAVK